MEIFTEYQVIYGLQYDVDCLQAVLNHMSAKGWTLTYVNANLLYAVFQRETETPDEQRTVWRLPKDWQPLPPHMPS